MIPKKKKGKKKGKGDERSNIIATKMEDMWTNNLKIEQQYLLFS